jgi:hypothetical protein
VHLEKSRDLGNGRSSAIMSLITCHCSGEIFLGGPSLTPRVRAASNPALVRSTIMLRSNSAKAPMMWKISLPPALVVSIFAVSDWKPTSRL